MELTLRQLENSPQALSVLTSIKLPISIAYQISRLVKKIEPELKIFHEAKNPILLEYIKKNKDGVEEVPEEKIAECQKMLEPLYATTIQLDCSRININDLGNASIEPYVFIMLDWLFTEGL